MLDTQTRDKPEIRGKSIEDKLIRLYRPKVDVVVASRRNEGTVDIKNTRVIIRSLKIILSDVQVSDMVFVIDALRVPFHISSKENMGKRL
jgi:hypothetical protein